MDLFEFADIWTRMDTYALTRCVEISFMSIGSGEITFYAEELRTNMRKSLIVTCQMFDRLAEPCKFLENILKNMIDEISV